MRCTPTARSWPTRRRRPPSGRRGSIATRRTSRPHGSAHAPATGSAATKRTSPNAIAPTSRQWRRPALAIAARPNAPEGHFWLAANMGGYAEDHGIRGGLEVSRRHPRRRSRRRSRSIRRSCRARPIARWDAGTTRCRACSAAASSKSEEHLRKALTYNPRSIISHIFLAETLEAARSQGGSDRGVEAGDRSVQPDPDWLPEDTEFKQQARTMLQEWQR